MRNEVRIALTIVIFFLVVFESFSAFSSAVPIESKSSLREGLTAIPYQNVTGGAEKVNYYVGRMTVMVTFSLRNVSIMNSLLKEVSNPGSSLFHKYLTKQEFVNMFSPTPSFYKEALNYFASQGIQVQAFQDRISIVLTASQAQMGNLFHTSFYNYSNGGRTFYAPSSQPELPAWLSSQVSYISGLNNFFIPSFQLNYTQFSPIQSQIGTVDESGYPVPILSQGNEYIWGPDLQVAYDEQSLLDIEYPINEVVATILWSGQTSGGQLTPPFYPSDVITYLNQELPAGEPLPKIYGAPINGAPYPSILSVYDVTGINAEGTLDLEMVGSLAPGASIYTVYGTNASQEQMDQAFAYILNPNASYSQLNDVSVISNSWGAPEVNDTAWYEYLQEAALRGITVLASSGDSGDNPYSSKFVPNNLYPSDVVNVPASMAFNYFGVTAVGGTTIYLNLTSNPNNYLHIFFQDAWYISSSYGDGGPAGSVGGLSQLFPEPIWQANTEANNVIEGQGRGVPDIAAIANNTLVGITGQNGYTVTSFWGTSIASPVVAGLVAVIDSLLSSNGQGGLGYLNPLVYYLANEQYSPLPSGQTVGTWEPGTYASYTYSLPENPFTDVVYGRNYFYTALTGYDLVTGWGSIDAYNFTTYILDVNYSGSPFAAQAVGDAFNITTLTAVSYYPNGTLDRYYNASIQQNFYVANCMGAPLYFVQNVIDIQRSGSGYNLWYNGWIVFPTIYNESVYEYNQPLGHYGTLPATFLMYSGLSNLNTFNSQTIYFGVNSQFISLPVPGAAYIIAADKYSFLWQNQIITLPPGRLAPQIGLVGGLDYAKADFLSPTSGYLYSIIFPMGLNSEIIAETGTYNYSISQTAEEAENLMWKFDDGKWMFNAVTNGSTIQGVASYMYPSSYYTENISETGLPKGTMWHMWIAGIIYSSDSSYFDIPIPTGAYNYSIYSPGYNSSPSQGTIFMNGEGGFLHINFSPVEYGVEMEISGLPPGTPWYLNISNGQSFRSTNSTLSFSEPNGSYSYTVSAGNKLYSTNSSAGMFTVSGGHLSISITFKEVTYLLRIEEQGLPDGILWSFILDGKNLSSTQNALSILEANGTYSYTIETPINAGIGTRYVSSESSGSITINGKNAYLNFSYHEQYYLTIVVNPSNGGSVLPPSGWYNTGYSITINALANGSFIFKSWSGTGNGSYSGKNNSSTITMNSPVTEQANFIELYSITFTESGLPNATIWYVNTSNGQSYSSSGTSISVHMPNGSYSYTIATEDKEYSAKGGLFIVNGSGMEVNIKFNLVTYAITFSESGLPSGTSWSLTLNNITESSTNGTIIFNEPNGTYSYSISGIQGYRTTSYSGTVIANGNTIDENITWSVILYPITITENGIPNGTSWSATITGTAFNGQYINVTLYSKTNTLTFNEPNGTYSYTIHLPSGYNGNNLKGSLNLTGKSVTSSIKAYQTTNPLLYLIVGLIAIIVVAGVVFALRSKRLKNE
ncbi:MAG: protease pro-enzyme activation domain-containing protein [Thermoplasmata archaeon]